MEAVPLEIKYANAINLIGGCPWMPLGWKESQGYDMTTSNFWYMAKCREDVQAEVTSARDLFLDLTSEHSRPVVQIGLYCVTGGWFVGWVQVIKSRPRADSTSNALIPPFYNDRNRWPDNYTAS